MGFFESFFKDGICFSENTSDIYTLVDSINTLYAGHTFSINHHDPDEYIQSLIVDLQSVQKLRNKYRRFKVIGEKHKKTLEYVKNNLPAEYLQDIPKYLLIP